LEGLAPVPRRELAEGDGLLSGDRMVPRREGLRADLEAGLSSEDWAEIFTGKEQKMKARGRLTRRTAMRLLFSQI